jgi:hypothetical protein
MARAQCKRPSASMHSTALALGRFVGIVADARRHHVARVATLAADMLEAEDVAELVSDGDCVIASPHARAAEIVSRLAADTVAALRRSDHAAAIVGQRNDNSPSLIERVLAIDVPHGAGVEYEVERVGVHHGLGRARVYNHHTERLRYAGSDSGAYCEGEQYGKAPRDMLSRRPISDACAFPRPCKTGRHDNGVERARPHP